MGSIAAAGGCTGADGNEGPPGKEGPPGPAGKDAVGGDDGADPSVNGITPHRVFLDRTVDVTISGSATTWTSGAKVDFGPGITINSTKVASPTAIVLNVTISDKAATGSRDVTVTEGGATTTFKGAFDVVAPLAITATAAQGSIFTGTIRQLDTNTPFDDTAQGDGLFTPITYPNLTVDAKAGVQASLETVTAFSLGFLAMVDVNVAPGNASISVISGKGKEAVTSAGTVDVAARTPTALSASTKGKVTSPLASLLYKYTATADELVTVAATTADPDAAPGFALLPASGKFADMIGYSASGTTSLLNGESIYVVYWDNSGTSNYEFDLKVDSKAADKEVEANNTCATAQAIAAGKPILASLANATDEDWYEVTATATEIGKKIRVVTSPGEGRTDTLVDVLAADCTTSLGGPSADKDYHENFASSALTAAGKYYVKVKASPFGFTGSKYAVTVTFE